MVKLIKGINDLATLRPDLALQWHPTKNGIFTPEMFTIGSEKKMWWICSKGHEWEAIIANRSNCGSGCPVCVGKQVLIGYNDLPTTNPELALQWHPTKNGDKTPKMFSKGSGEKAWWICPLGHEWEAQISSRSQGNGCPICYGRQTLAGYNDLTTTHPQLAKQWHPTKNGTLTPEMFTQWSNEKAWWICPLGHEWEARIANRSKCGSGCPICSGHSVLKGLTDLLTTNPELAKEWHPSKNGTLTPQNVTQYSGKKVWWICPKGHVWQATIANRSKGSGCPICYGRQVLSGYNDLATINTKLAKQWHPTKNGTLKPTDVTQHSGIKVWWICPLGHEWEAKICSRSIGRGCPICAGKQVLIGYNDLLTTTPQLASEWHPTKNGNLKPTDVTQHSGKTAWWICPKGHVWQATVNTRSKGMGCPVCAGNRVVSGYNDLLTTNPELASQWHPTKNGDRTPRMFTNRSKKKASWICPKGHEWEATISNRSKDASCPICKQLN